MAKISGVLDYLKSLSAYEQNELVMMMDSYGTLDLCHDKPNDTMTPKLTFDETSGSKLRLRSYSPDTTPSMHSPINDFGRDWAERSRRSSWNKRLSSEQANVVLPTRCILWRAIPSRSPLSRMICTAPTLTPSWDGTNIQVSVSAT